MDSDPQEWIYTSGESISCRSETGTLMIQHKGQGVLNALAKSSVEIHDSVVGTYEYSVRGFLPADLFMTVEELGYQEEISSVLDESSNVFAERNLSVSFLVEDYLIVRVLYFNSLKNNNIDYLLDEEGELLTDFVVVNKQSSRIQYFTNCLTR